MVDFRHAEVVPGIPAESGELIVQRRLNILTKYPDFMRAELDCLDAGCGNGASMIELSERFRSCHGVDANASYIDQFLRAVETRSIDNCTARVGDLCGTFSAPESFDRAISFEVIEHLPDERAGVASLYHSLKPGGMLAVSVPNKWWIFETHGAWLPELPLVRWYRVPFLSWLPGPIHARIAKARIYTRRRITRLLVDSGFHILKTTYVTAPMDRLTIPPLQWLARRTLFHGDTTVIPILATSILVIAVKK